MNRLHYDYDKIIKSNQSEMKNPQLQIKYNNHLIFNSGHPNIDNYAEIYSQGKITSYNSFRLSFSGKWVMIEIEPYQIINKTHYPSDIKNIDVGTFQINNNTLIKGNEINKVSGLKQSQIILHYNGLGLGYGKISHWWSPGYHSAISLSSNFRSLETFSIGSFKDQRFGNFSISGKIIVMPYQSTEGIQLYFSGLNGSFIYHSNPEINFGFNRTYISGNIANLQNDTNFSGQWTMIDAANLVIEPLFGSSKVGLDYTIPGTPGFDYWDEVLTGYIKI
jgi:hypothetical protein